MSDLMCPMSRPAYTYSDDQLWSRVAWSVFTTHFWCFKLRDARDHVGLVCAM